MLLTAAAHAGVSLSVTSPSSTPATVITPTTIKANATSGYPISSWQIYVDGTKVWYTGATASISAPLTLTAGTHRVSVYAKDSSGAQANKVLSLTAVSATTPVNVVISNPINSSVVPVTFTLKASSASGVNRWTVYSDGVAVWNGTGTAIAPALTLAVGTHNLTARAWNLAGGFGDGIVTLTVATNPIPTPPTNAVVFNHIEDMSGWGDCTDCAANPNDPTPPLAQYYRAQFQTTPAMDGSSTKFWVGGTDPYADALHWKKFGAQNAYRNFIWDFYVYVEADSLNAQNLEFDLFQAVGKMKYMFGTQCNYKKGIWQTWNYTSKWLDTTIPCEKFAPGKWTRVVWYLQRTTDNRLKYISLSVGNTTYMLNQYQMPGPTTWGDTLGVQYQQDLNSLPSPYSQWIDNVKVSMW